jgi:hypothetical protein
MTVQAIEGTLKIPGTPVAAAALAELGFGRSVPEGQMALSEAFRPNPDNDPGSTALFNIFLESHDFSGEVYLIKTAPVDTKEFQNCKFRVLRAGAEVAWPIEPDEHLSDTMQEPENGVSYYLAIFGATPGQEVYYRMSL